MTTPNYDQFYSKAKPRQEPLYMQDYPLIYRGTAHPERKGQACRKCAGLGGWGMYCVITFADGFVCQGPSSAAVRAKVRDAR